MDDIENDMREPEDLISHKAYGILHPSAQEKTGMAYKEREVGYSSYEPKPIKCELRPTPLSRHVNDEVDASQADRLRAELAALRQRCDTLEKDLRQARQQWKYFGDRARKAEAERDALREAMKVIANTLDGTLGDTDPYLPEGITDEEIRDEDPVWWCCREAFKFDNATAHGEGEQ